MVRSTRARLVAAVSALALVLFSVMTSAAQSGPVQVIQAGDGTLYLAQPPNAWRMVPNPISDDGLAALTPSGELDGAIPAPFLVASDVLAPLQVVQDDGGTLYLVQGANVWTLVPAQVSDADLGALTVIGEFDGNIVPPAIAASNPPVEPSPPPAPGPVAPPVSPPTVPAPANPNGTITIVSSLPRNGSNTSQTDSMVNAFKMALDEVQNSVAGFAITYQDMDGATRSKADWDAAQEAQNANQAINDSNVMVYIGGATWTDLNAPRGRFSFGGSGSAKVAIPILCRSNLGMISPVVTYSGLTRKIPGAFSTNEPDAYYPGCSRNFTRVVPGDDVQGSAAARWSKDLGATKAYVVYEDEGAGSAAVYAATAPKVGLRLVADPDPLEPYNGAYATLAQKIRQSGADVVFFGDVGRADAGNLWRDLRATLGNNVKLMGPNGIFNQEFIDVAGPAAEGTYAVSANVPLNKLGGASAQWYANYKAQFNAEPGGYAIYGYEAMKVVLDAIQRTGKKDRAAIRDAIINTRNYDGVLGKWSFTETGDTTLNTVYGRQVRNGRYDDANSVVLQAP